MKENFLKISRAQRIRTDRIKKRFGYCSDREVYNMLLLMFYSYDNTERGNKSND